MDEKCLYELTVRCTEDECQEDLAIYKVDKIENGIIYAGPKIVSNKSLMKVERIKVDSGEMILRVPFFGKEAALVWIRDIFLTIREKGTPGMYYVAKDEWMKILNPKYDVNWFTGGQKVEEWRQEIEQLASKL